MDVYEREVYKSLEAKLKELMPENEFIAFMQRTCAKAFREDVNSFDVGTCKQFVLDTIDKIMKEEGLSDE